MSKVQLESFPLALDMEDSNHFLVYAPQVRDSNDHLEGSNCQAGNREGNASCQLGPLHTTQPVLRSTPRENA